jgi:hypothetical protein
MLIPSGIRPPDDHETKTEQVGSGLYVATNAYEGDYNYFQNGTPGDGGDTGIASGTPSHTAPLE